MIRDAILDALKKMPESKEVWLHPKHKDENLSDLGLEIKFSPLMPLDQFLLSQEEMGLIMEIELSKWRSIK